MGLLDLPFEGSAELRQQAVVTAVVGKCRCGCASVDLRVDESQAKPARVTVSPIPAEGDWAGGGIILFVEDGWLSYLEIYANSDDPPREFPPPNEIDFHLP